MVDFIYANRFKDDSVKKNLVISWTSGGTTHQFTNTDLYQGEFELNESLCSEQNIKFGTCESASIKFKIGVLAYGSSLVGKWLTVEMYVDGDSSHRLSLGRFKVVADKETADHHAREIEAYDAMYTLLNKEVKKWYKNAFPSGGGTLTLKQFRNSFFAQSWVANMGITQDTITLVNDDIPISKTIDPESLSSKTVLNAICEANGVFGHIGRDNKFHYISLKEMGEGLYPNEELRPNDNLFPKDSGIDDIIFTSTYKDCQYEAYETHVIDGLYIQSEDGDVGGESLPILSTPENPYTIQGNFLLYGLNTDVINLVAYNIMQLISVIKYRPATIQAKGNPCLEVGDTLRCKTGNQVVETYILQRTLKGIQMLDDTYISTGDELLGESVNSTSEDIIKLKNKTNILKRTSDATVSHLSVIDSQIGTFDSKITQTAKEITLEVSSSSKVWNEGNYNIKWRGTEEPSTGFPDSKKSSATVNDYYLNTSNGYLYQLTAKSGTTLTWTKKANLSQYATSAYSKFIQHDDSISAKVSQTGHNSSSTFEWSLTSSAFDLYSTINGSRKRVFRCNNNGISVEGTITATAGKIGDCNITNGVLKVGSANITSITADKITSGTLNVQNIEVTGTFNGSAIPDLSASKITSGTFATARIPNLSASKITSGTISADRISSSFLNSDTYFNAKYANITTLKIASTIQWDYGQGTEAYSPLTVVINGHTYHLIGLAIN